MPQSKEAMRNKLLVAAIDFDTIFSGLAFSVRNNKGRDLPNISANTAWSSSQGKASMKSDELELAPEPEAARVICVTTNRMPGKSSFVNTFAPFENKRHVVLDFEGRINDIQAHEINAAPIPTQRLARNTKKKKDNDDLFSWTIGGYYEEPMRRLHVHEDPKERILRYFEEIKRSFHVHEDPKERILREYEDLQERPLRECEVIEEQKKLQNIDINKSRKLTETVPFRSDHVVLQDDADSFTRKISPETMLETLKRISEGTRFYEHYSHRVVYKHKETASDFLKTIEDMKTKGNVKGKRKLSSQKREWHTMSPQEELFSEEDWTYILVYLEFLFQTNMKTNVTVWIDLVLPRCIAKPGIYLNSKRSVEDTIKKINDKTSSDVYSEKIGAEMKLKSALLKKSTVLCAEQSCTRQWPASRKSCNSMTSEENHSFGYERSCKICYGEEACVVFLPCSHMIACENCSSMLQHCAMCRALIRGSFVVELNITL